MTLDIVVYGRPAPQGSKMARAIYRGSGTTREFTGKVAQVENSKGHVAEWRADVRAAAADALGDASPLDGPLTVRMVFTFARPKSHYRTGRNAHLLRADAPTAPAGKPDLSKVLRSTEDALTSVAFWKDDSLVVEYARLAKVYPGEDPEALDRPGVLIRIDTAAGYLATEGS